MTIPLQESISPDLFDMDLIMDPAIYFHEKYLQESVMPFETIMEGTTKGNVVQKLIETIKRVGKWISEQFQRLINWITGNKNPKKKSATQVAMIALGVGALGAAGLAVANKNGITPNTIFRSKDNKTVDVPVNANEFKKFTYSEVLINMVGNGDSIVIQNLKNGPQTRNIAIAVSLMRDQNLTDTFKQIIIGITAIKNDPNKVDVNAIAQSITAYTDAIKKINVNTTNTDPNSFNWTTPISVASLSSFNRDFQKIISEFEQIQTNQELPIYSAPGFADQVNRVSGIIMGIQNGLYMIMTAFTNIYLIDASLIGTINDIEKLSVFVDEMQQAGIPANYIYWNAFAICSDTLRSSNPNVRVNQNFLYMDTPDNKEELRVSISPQGKRINAINNALHTYLENLMVNITGFSNNGAVIKCEKVESYEDYKKRVSVPHVIEQATGTYRMAMDQKISAIGSSSLDPNVARTINIDIALKNIGARADGTIVFLGLDTANAMANNMQQVTDAMNPAPQQPVQQQPQQQVTGESTELVLISNETLMESKSLDEVLDPYDPYFYFEEVSNYDFDHIMMEAQGATIGGLFYNLIKIIIRSLWKAITSFGKVTTWLHNYSAPEQKHPSTVDQILASMHIVRHPGIDMEGKQVVPWDPQNSEEGYPEYIKAIEKPLMIEFGRTKDEIIITPLKYIKHKLDGTEMEPVSNLHKDLKDPRGILIVLRFINHPELLDELDDVIMACTFDHITPEITKKMDSIFGNAIFHPNMNPFYKCTLADLENLNKRLMLMHRSLERFDNPQAEMKNTSKPVLDAMNRLTFGIANIQTGANMIATAVKHAYVIDNGYCETITDVHLLDEFVYQMIAAGIPGKYIAFNTWMVSSPTVKGSAKIHKPCWGQTRVTFFPDEKDVVYKIAYNGQGIRANKVEWETYKQVKACGMDERFAAIYDLGKNGCVEVMEKVIVDKLRATPYVPQVKKGMDTALKRSGIRGTITDVKGANLGFRMSGGIPVAVSIDYGFINRKSQPVGLESVQNPYQLIDGNILMESFDLDYGITTIDPVDYFQEAQQIKGLKEKLTSLSNNVTSSNISQKLTQMLKKLWEWIKTQCKKIADWFRARFGKQKKTVSATQIVTRVLGTTAAVAGVTAAAAGGAVIRFKLKKRHAATVVHKPKSSKNIEILSGDETGEVSSVEQIELAAIYNKFYAEFNNSRPNTPYFVLKKHRDTTDEDYDKYGVRAVILFLTDDNVLQQFQDNVKNLNDPNGDLTEFQNFLKNYENYVKGANVDAQILIQTLISKLDALSSIEITIDENDPRLADAAMKEAFNRFTGYVKQIQRGVKLLVDTFANVYSVEEHHHGAVDSYDKLDEIVYQFIDAKFPSKYIIRNIKLLCDGALMPSDTDMDDINADFTGFIDNKNQTVRLALTSNGIQKNIRTEQLQTGPLFNYIPNFQIGAKKVLTVWPSLPAPTVDEVNNFWTQTMQPAMVNAGTDVNMVTNKDDVQSFGKNTDGSIVYLGVV